MAKTSKKERVEKIIYFEVDRVKEFDWGIVFDLEINGVKIYSCRVINHKGHKFIGFPQEKGKDGNFYNRAYFNFSDDDMQKVIEEVEEMI